MLTWTSNERHLAVFNRIGAAYLEQHKDKVSEVVFDGVVDGTYLKALTTQIGGGDVPDLAWTFEGMAAQFIDSGVFANLTPTLTAVPDYHVDDLVDGAMDLWRKDGDIYAYPFSNSPLGIYANLDVIKAAKLPSPRDLLASGEWTWDKLMEMAAAIGKQADRAGFQSAADPAKDWNSALGPIWLSWNARPWTADGRTCTFAAPEMVTFLEWFHRQIFVAGAMPQPGQQFDFAAGQVGFRMAQLSMSAGLKDSFEWDFLPMPAGPSGTVPVVGQGAVGVVAQGRNPEIAADFLAYFTNKENSALLAAFFPPPRKSLLAVEALSTAAPALTSAQIQGTVIDQAVKAVTKVGHAKLSELDDPIRAGLDALWHKDADVRRVLETLTAAVQKIIDE